MKKIIVFAAVAISAMLFSGTAFAHTKLTASSPAENAAAESPVTEIVLDFNTDIEPVSRITVTNERGEEVPLEDIQVSGARLTGKLADPLPNGAYTVSWKIIGADGHAVNGSYSFAVNAPAASGTPSAAPAENAAHAGHHGHASHAPSASAETPADDAEQSVSATGQEAALAAAAAPNAQAESEAQAGSDAQESAAENGGGAGAYWLIAAAVIVVAAAVVFLRMRKKRA